MPQENWKAIRAIAKRRGITKLYHFTPLDNVASILRNGLASQSLLRHHDIPFLAPDRQRLDNRLDALSLSIHSVNKALLIAYVARSGGDWAILEIDASVLWTHACRFCWTNAASSQLTAHRGFLGGTWAFERMFQDRPVSTVDLRSQREVYSRLDNQPTDMQAEVQVLQPIDSDLVIDFTVKSQSVKKRLEVIMATANERRPVTVNEFAFH
jgi:hypothetical protein